MRLVTGLVKDRLLGCGIGYILGSLVRVGGRDRMQGPGIEVGS